MSSNSAQLSCLPPCFPIGRGAFASCFSTGRRIARRLHARGDEPYRCIEEAHLNGIVPQTPGLPCLTGEGLKGALVAAYRQ